MGTRSGRSVSGSNRSAPRPWSVLKRKLPKLPPVLPIDHCGRTSRKGTFIKRNKTVASEARRFEFQTNKRDVVEHEWQRFKSDIGGRGFGDSDVYVLKRKLSEPVRWPTGYDYRKIKEESRAAMEDKAAKMVQLEVDANEERKVRMAKEKEERRSYLLIAENS